MTDDELMRRYQDGMRRAETAPPNAPDPDTVRRVARGDATEAERLRVLDAVMQSDELRMEYDTFRALAAGARSAALVWPRRLAAAALIAVVAGSGYWALISPTPEASWRGGGSGLTTIAPSDGAEIAAPVRLVWHPLPGTKVYQVEIMEENGRLVAQFETRDTTFVVPPEIGLRVGIPYRWGVMARRDRGESVNSSLGKFTVRD